MKKIILAVMLVSFAVAGDWKDGYSPMAKDKWLKLGITDKNEAIKWRKLKLYISYPDEHKIVKELLKANISADKCVTITKEICKANRWKYRKSSCKNNYLKVIAYTANDTNKVGVVNTAEKVKSKKPNDNTKKVISKIKKQEKWMDGYSPMAKDKWLELGITTKEEALKWRRLRFYAQYDSEIIKKLLEKGISAEKCDEIAEMTTKYYKKSSCKNKYEDIISFVNTHGLINKEEYTNKQLLDEWRLYGITNLNEIKKWLNLNFSLRNSKDENAIRYFVLHTISADNVKKWAKIFKQNPDSEKNINQIQTMISYKININEAKQWLDSNIKFDHIIKWKQLNVKTPKRANEIISKNFSLKDYIYITDNKITFDEAVKWKQGNYFTLKSMVKWKQAMVDNPKEALDWKKIEISYHSVKKIKQSGYGLPSELKKVCSSFISADDFIAKKSSTLNNKCFAGAFKITKVSSSNKVSATVVVRKYDMYMQSKLDLGDKSTTIKASDKLSKDFKNNYIITGIFKVNDGTFSSYLERISY